MSFPDLRFLSSILYWHLLINKKISSNRKATARHRLSVRRRSGARLMKINKDLFGGRDSCCQVIAYLHVSERSVVAPCAGWVDPRAQRIDVSTLYRNYCHWRYILGHGLCTGKIQICLVGFVPLQRLKDIFEQPPYLEAKFRGGIRQAGCREHTPEESERTVVDQIGNAINFIVSMVETIVWVRSLSVKCTREPNLSRA